MKDETIQKATKFETFLKDKHAEGYTGTDDEMSDDFELWLSEIGIDETIEYANQWLTNHDKEKAGEVVRKIGDLKKEKIADRQLYKFDGKVEQIKYYENDSDPAYNQALTHALSIVKEVYHY